MTLKEGRKFLKFFDMDEYEAVVPNSDQEKGVDRPLAQQPFPVTGELIDLIPPENFTIGNTSFLEVINKRKSRRKFTADPLSLEELSYLLWCTQGVKKQTKFGMFRTVPSAGARNPFETYLLINHVEGIKPGLYRYISLDHKLLFVKLINNAPETFAKLAYEQKFAGECAVLFIWTAIPYRTEWRYSILSHKFIAIDLGLVNENLYLACESINLGTVAIGYYEQQKMDALLDLNAEEEFVVLIAPVGKYKKRMSLEEFLIHEEVPVSLEEKRIITGIYSREGIPEDLEITLENEDIILKSPSFSEKFQAVNPTEYIGGDLIRAIRIIFGDDGKVAQAEFLMGLLSSTDVLIFIPKSD